MARSRCSHVSRRKKKASSTSCSNCCIRFSKPRKTSAHLAVGFRKEFTMEEQPTQTLIEDRQMPNAALRLLFLSIEEVMGSDGTKAVLNGAKMPQYIGNYPPNNLVLGVSFSAYG